MSSESTVQKQIWLALGHICRLFRLNTGMGWISGLGPKGVHRLQDGSVRIEAARPIPLGFGMPNGKPVVGAGDLPGWTTIIITPEMVGCRCAVFTSIECKRTDGGRLSAEQRNWINQIKNAGGIAGVASSAEVAMRIVEDYRPPAADMLEKEDA